MVCTHFSQLMKIQVEIIQRHIHEHKYFQHIEDKDQAVKDFIHKYAWIMRETYCLACPDNKVCDYDPDCELYSSKTA